MYFSSGEGAQIDAHPHILRKTSLLSIKIYTIIEQTKLGKFKINNADIFWYTVQKSQIKSKKKIFICSEPLAEIQ